MSKKTRILEILNKRRIEIKSNIEKFEIEMARYQSRMNSLRDNHDQYSMELAAIDIQLSDLTSDKNFDIKLHIVHGEHQTNLSKLMIEINLENHPPIFKLISDFDLVTYSRKTTTDQLIFKSRLKELAEEWLSRQDSISELFTETNKKLENALENYLYDESFDRKIRRGSMLFPFIHQD
jgi:carbonic anhydrase